MELGMWLRVFLFLFVAGRVTRAGSINEEAFGKLCDIAGNVSVLMEKEGGGTKNSLERALYGTGGRADFKDAGTVSMGGCGSHWRGRSHFCSNRPDYRELWQPGCFADSLFGTFICLCTKGNDDHHDLCGLGNLTSNESWGDWSRPQENLSKSVWNAVKQKCITEKNATVNASVHVGGLENALQNLTGSLKNLTNGYVSLGGNSTDGSCNGSDANEACVTYKGPVNGPNIPWADKISSALNTSKTQKQANPKTSATPAGPGRRQSYTTGREHPSGSGTDRDDQHEEEGNKDSVENASAEYLSETLHPRRKRHTQKPTEETMGALTALLYKGDSSFLTQQFWFLIAVFVF